MLGYHQMRFGYMRLKVGSQKLSDGLVAVFYTVPLPHVFIKSRSIDVPD